MQFYAPHIRVNVDCYPLVKGNRSAKRKWCAGQIHVSEPYASQISALEVKPIIRCRFNR